MAERYTERLTLMITPELRTELTAIAAAEFCSMPAIAREAIAQYLQRRRAAKAPRKRRVRSW